jgi:D-alanyl-D-alanine carboxypeptidase
MRRPSAVRCASITLLVGGLVLAFSAAGAVARTTMAVLQRDLGRLVAARGGPVGAIATLYRNGRITVIRAGRADARRPGAPRLGDHMRIASVAKAFNGAVILHLVQKGLLGLDDTIGQRLPGMPLAWSRVTIREMLGHTGGLPDYTHSDGARKHVMTNPRGYVSPRQLIDYVRNERLRFPPGTRYEYSNTDNVVLGLIAERVTGQSYGRLLSTIVFSRAGLTQTSFPTRQITLPAPFIHGYQVEPGEAPQDVTTFLSPSGAWASGGIVSTPRDLGAFIRAELTGRFFGLAQRRQQFRFRVGSSDPPGPGTNSAGLSLFRYRTRCGPLYGHTGSFPGYAQWVAATADGRRSVTTSLNIAPPTGAPLGRLRAFQASMVCALLGK